MSTHALSWVAAQGLIACVCFAWIASAAQAQTSPGTGRAGAADPTRPPAASSGTIAAPSPAQPAPRSAQAASSNTASALPRPTPAPRLQSIHLPDTGPASALVDGRLVRVGERIDAWQVERITHDGLMLRSVVTASDTPASTAAPRPERRPDRAGLSQATQASQATRHRWLPLLPATAAAIDTAQAVDTPRPTAPVTPHPARTAARKEP